VDNDTRGLRERPINGLSRRAETFLLWGARLPLFILPFIPLIVTPDLLFPYVSGKNFAFRILIEFSLLLYSSIIIFYRQPHLSVTSIFLSISIFTFTVGLSDIFGINPYRSFWSDYERMEGYITTIHLAVLFLLFRSLFRTQRDWKILLNLFVLGGVLACIYAVINPIPMRIMRFTEDYRGRLYGSLGNPPFLASYLLLVSIVGLILMCKTERAFFKLFYILCICLNLSVIYLTASRGAIIALFAGMITFILWFYIRKDDSKRWMMIASLLVLVIAIIGIAVRGGDLLSSSKVYQRFHNLFSDPSVMTRLTIWKMALNGFIHRPILGWGQENFISIYTVNTIPFVDDYAFVNRAHNILIEWLVNSGIAGLISYLLIFVSVIYTYLLAYKRGACRRAEFIIFTTGIIVYTIQNLFTFDTISTYIIIYSLFAYADTYNDRERKTPPATGLKGPFLRIVLFFLSLSAFTYVLFKANIEPIKEGMLLRKVIDSPSERYQSYTSLLRDLEEALRYHSFADPMVRRQMVYISGHIVRNRLLNTEGAIEFLKRTDEALQEELRREAYNLEYITLVINYLYEFAKIEDRILPNLETLLKRYISLAPGYEWLYFRLADVYAMKGDDKGAFEIIRKAISISPLNDKKLFKLTIAAILASEDDVVRDSLNTIERMRRPEDGGRGSGGISYLTEEEVFIMAQTYIKKRDFSKAMDLYKRLIELSPNKASYHFDMAMLYRIEGNEEMAMNEAKKASEIDPHYKDRFPSTPSH